MLKEFVAPLLTFAILIFLAGWVPLLERVALWVGRYRTHPRAWQRAGSAPEPRESPVPSI